MVITSEGAVDEGPSGFFRRNRVRRLAVGDVTTELLRAKDARHHPEEST